MKHNRLLAFLIVISPLLSVTPPAFAHPNHENQPPPIPVLPLRMELSGDTEKGRLFSAKIKLNDLRGIDTKGEWFADLGVDSHNSVDKIRFSIDKKSVSIPKDAYQDLFNIVLPRGFYIVEVGDQLHMRFRGGEGASAYTVYYKFTEQGLLSRRIEYYDQQGQFQFIDKDYIRHEHEEP